jgi:deoxycytidylate deaminase
MTCGVPCKDCMVEIIEAGISELVVREIYEDSHDYYDLQSEYLSKKTLMKIRKWELDA